MPKRSLINTLSKFNVYIQGGSNCSPEALKEHLKYYDKRIAKLNSHFYLKSIKNTPKIQEKIEDILRSLNIPQKQWSKYFDSEMSIYDFLVELKKEGHNQVDYIIALIDEKTSLAKAKFILGCIVTGGFMAGSASQPEIAGILGILNTCISALPSLYESHFDKKKTSSARFRDDSFILINALTNALAYAIWAATTISPLVGSVFVTASIVNVVKELYNTAQSWTEYKNLSPIHESNNLSIHQTYARREYNYRQHRNAALINIAISAILVVVMAAWCFLPGGIFVTVGALLANITLAKVKTSLHNKNESTIREQLHEELRDLKEIYKRFDATFSEQYSSFDTPADESTFTEEARKIKVTDSPKQKTNQYTFFSMPSSKDTQDASGNTAWADFSWR